MKLLIVDDNKYVVTLLRRQLNWEAFGIEELIGVYSVEEAKAALRSTEIDFLISDIEMPVENGFDLLEWIRTQELSPEVVLLTSYADFSYAKKAIKYGCFDYLLKPVARQDLEEVVRKLVIKRIEDKKQLRLQQFGNNWISHQNLIKEMFWRDVIGDDTASDPERIVEKIRKEQMPYEMDQKFVPILICMEEEREGFGRELLSFTCENVLSEIAAGGKPKLEFLSYNGYAQFASVFRGGGGCLTGRTVSGDGRAVCGNVFAVLPQGSRLLCGKALYDCGGGKKDPEAGGNLFQQYQPGKRRIPGK